MTLLDFEECQGLTQIPDVSGMPNLEKISFKNCKSLNTIHDSIGFLGKLNSLNAVGCSKLRSFPPLKLTSLKNLELSYCYGLESFPEVLGKMGKITKLVLEDCNIKELPFSFQNLTELQTLQLRFCPMLRLPSSIVMMPKLAEIIVWESKGWLFPKQVEVEEKVSSMVSSNVDCLLLPRCKLSDDFLPIALAWFANVKELDLSWNNFTVLPECISNCHFLSKLTLDGCHSLREIRGIPPNIQLLLAVDCKSFTSSCRSTLLNQKLHEAGNTMFRLSGASFPEWFDHHNQGPSCSFWVGNKFPSIALCIAIGPAHLEHVTIDRPIININGVKCSLHGEEKPYLNMLPHHTYLFDLQHIVFSDYLDRFVTENEWNHVEITYSVKQRFNEKDKHAVTPVSVENGIYVLKQRSSMEDIQFTDPHKKRRLDVDPE
ncbi:internalin A [Vigna unguiculata]|uniref:Internalin A n=3 Tax=Vigna unguiculata TaxID=3917 RepID=A0A4D6M4Y9_VIGUN|nr:internalin A [Vigna unguiculata]